MARKPSQRPWLHAKSGYWCATIAGKRVYLDRDPRVAERKLKHIRTEQKRNGNVCRDWQDASFAELADEFLSDLQARRKPGTYEQARYGLLRALRILGTSLRVGEIRRIHLSKIEQAMTNRYSPSTLRNTLAIVQQVFSWAVEHELVEVNPLIGYRKPAQRCRTRTISADEFQKLLRVSAKNRPFQRVLIALRLTGCRPGELRNLTWDMVDLEQGLWVIPDHKTITTQRQPRPRVIPLPTPVWQLCHWLHQRSRQQSGNHVFLNAHGQPFSRGCLAHAMSRGRQRAGLGKKAGESIVLYSNRHTYGTEAAGKVSDIELAEMMGHTDTLMTRRYVHMNTGRLHDIQQRIQRAE